MKIRAPFTEFCPGLAALAFATVWAAIAVAAIPSAAMAETKRVVLLHSFGQDFKPWKEYGEYIREELKRQSPWQMDIQEHSLVTARFSDESLETAFVEYLRSLYLKYPPDLIVSIGAPAAGFVQRHRQQLFTSTPMILTAVENRRVQQSMLTGFDAVVAVAHDYGAVFENILRVLPHTRTVVVVNGHSPNERFWLQEMRREAEPFANRLAFRWTDDVSFQDFLKQAAALPPDTAIFWHLMNVDATGVVYEGDAGLTMLHAVANAPIFTYDDAFFGREIVGGPMYSAREGGRTAAAVAMRILSGEKAGDIKTPPAQFAAPRYDWRQLQKWKISENRLPPGSAILFREPTAWEEYRPQALAAIAVVLAEAALIFWLLYERRRRHLAEQFARDTMAELTHMNRVAMGGELSASIAHEVNQPLTGIVTRAHAALRWLAMERPNIEEARAALTQIVNAGHRAGDIIAGVRALFRKDTSERKPVDVNELISIVLAIVRADLERYDVELETQLHEALPLVSADRVQLQQVILNLVMNAIESMRTVRPRVLRVRSAVDEAKVITVEIEDTGTGIGQAHLDRIFQPLFTTKAGGMGMGLSICRSIIESHDGRIWASAVVNRGSIFHFELPLEHGSVAA